MIANVINGVVVAVFQDDETPAVHKGALLPIEDAPKPDAVEGFKWISAWSVSESSVKRLWVSVTKGDSEKESDAIAGVIQAMRSGSGTVAERIQRLERVAAHLAKLEVERSAL